ncbi:hypothetical protein TSAR_011286 [Trichomalopsis sarcophagae]|uniref:Uncharacterized protein n=1 Tax=Trichomalopsis sarcophagae TaxID=543379 RepID=A0A232FFI1_9HYME|nr:hypothetical protein TSAR_011286 [Trichomalopsis sarcophagae]
MLYQKLVFVLLVLATANALQIHKFSRASLFRGSVIKINRTLIEISNSANSISLTWGNDRKSCSLSFPALLKSSNYSSFVKVSVLGNDKIILRSYESDGSTKTWRFLVVNHQTCVSREIGEKIRTDIQDADISTVIAYNDSFDIFSDNKVCSPCRYNDKGEKIKLDHTLVQSSTSGLRDSHSDKKIRISPINEKTSSEGYLLIQEFSNNCSTLLQRLDSTFQVVAQRHLNLTVNAFSTDYEKLRICSLPHCNSNGKSAAREPLTCQLLDAGNLETLNTSKLDQVASGRDLKSVLVQNLPDGTAKVTYVYDKDCFEGDGEGAFAEIYDQRINVGGKVEQAIKFQESVLCWDYRLESIVLGPDEYCTIAYDGVATVEFPQTVYQTCTRKI